VLSIDYRLSAAEVERILQLSCVDLGSPGYDTTFGCGFVNAYAAVVWAAYETVGVDLNSDGTVDFVDYSIFSLAWLKGEGQPGWNVACDLYKPADGVVNASDLAVLAEYWLMDTPSLNLIAHWTFDETEGEIPSDSVGGNHGTLNGNPIWQATGGALQFDGGH
jgi:hypothetical protein